MEQSLFKDSKLGPGETGLSSVDSFSKSMKISLDQSLLKNSKLGSRDTALCLGKGCSEKSGGSCTAQSLFKDSQLRDRDQRLLLVGSLKDRLQAPYCDLWVIELVQTSSSDTSLLSHGNSGSDSNDLRNSANMNALTRQLSLSSALSCNIFELDG